MCSLRDVSPATSSNVMGVTCRSWAGFRASLSLLLIKMHFQNHFKGKKITVMGLGLLGRGVGDAEFLAECGADLIVTDLKTKEQLADSVAKLEKHPNMQFVLGEHRKEDFENRDMILVAPSVPLDSEYVAHGVATGARKAQSAALFAELTKIPIIGVTGTRGKSTTSQMIHHVLQTVTGEEVILGGTVRGVSNLQLLKKVKGDSLAVFELDSWQLQGFGWASISPQIAVFTNFMEDHMNYYHGDMDAYFADKANIFINQEESGVFITTPEVFERAKKFAAGKNITLGQEVVLVDSSTLPEDTLLSVPGEHNRLNAALAYEACKATGLTDEEIFNALASFPGVEGRLQFLAEINGVKIYNDNNATTPQATVAGLEALDKNKNIVLIVGGTDKDISLSELPEAIARHCSHVILYSGTGTEKLKAVLPPDVSVEEHGTLAECVQAAIATSIPGNVILFSPGFSSFGKEYKNEYDRNDQFVALINKLSSGV